MELERTVADDRLQAFVARAGSLYSLPGVAMQVLELTGHPKVDAAALKRCIENDPALTSKILKVVNSSLFGLSREVSDLHQALALLGIKPLKLLVLGFSLPEQLVSDVSGEMLSYYWRRTLTKAVAARELSEMVFRQPGDEAFIAGLLSDLGILVLLQDLGPPYADFLQTVFDGSGDLLELEHEALGFNHTMLSARLLEQWGLPEALVQAIAMPQNSKTLQALAGPRGALPQTLHLAELLTQIVADHRISALPELLESGRAYRHMTREQISRLVETLGVKVAALADVLSLEFSLDQDYRDVLLEAHRRLAEVAADVAATVGRTQREELDACEMLLSQTRSLADAAARAARPAARETSQTSHESAPVANGVVRIHDAAPRATPPLRSALARKPLIAPPQVECDAALAHPLTVAVADCRQRRCELSLLLIEIDRWRELVDQAGGQAGERVITLVQSACRALEHPRMRVLSMGAGRLAVLLPDCDWRMAAQVAGQLRRDLHKLLSGPRHDGPRHDGPPPLSISIGAATVALPPKNFPPAELQTAAQRCLHAAQAAGGNSVKSIEIY